jgi:rhodanese-related sulfurtransferase
MFDPDPTTPEISARDAIGLAKNGVRLIDVREQHEWDAGHAPDATLLPMSVLESRVDEIPIAEKVLFVCHSGQRSGRVTDALVRMGYDAVNVSGGMLAWRDAGGDLVSGGSEAPRV